MSSSVMIISHVHGFPCISSLVMFCFGGAGGVVVIHLALHQWVEWVRGSIPATGYMYVQMVFPIHARSPWFSPGSPVSPAFKIGTCLAHSKTSLHPGGMGSCCV